MQAAQKHYSSVQALLISERNRAQEEATGARGRSPRPLLSPMHPRPSWLMSRASSLNRSLRRRHSRPSAMRRPSQRQRPPGRRPLKPSKQKRQPRSPKASVAAALHPRPRTRPPRVPADQSTSPPKHPTSNAQGEIAVHAASFLGVPVRLGRSEPFGSRLLGSGHARMGGRGRDLVHSAALQAQMSTPVPLTQLQPGDLLFYDFGGTGIDHVIMYVGSGPYGSNTIIQAAHTGTVVSFDPSGTKVWSGAGRP